MSMSRAGIILGLALFVGTGAAAAADTNGAFGVKGVGMTKCSQFVQIVRDNGLPVNGMPDQRTLLQLFRSER